MIIITDSNKNEEYFKQKYGIAINDRLIRLQSYRGSWLNTIPFDPSKNYSVNINSDEYFINLCNNNEIVIDYNFMSSYELLGLLLHDFHKHGIYNISINCNNERMSLCCPDYVEKITNVLYLKKYSVVKRLLNSTIYLHRPWIKNIYHYKVICSMINNFDINSLIKKLNSKKITEDKILNMHNGVFWPILDMDIDVMPDAKLIDFTSYNNRYIDLDKNYNLNIFKNRVSNIIIDKKFSLCNTDEDDWYIDTIFDLLNLEQNDKMSVYNGYIIPCGHDIIKCFYISKDNTNHIKTFNDKINVFISILKGIIDMNDDLNQMCKNIWRAKNDI